MANSENASSTDILKDALEEFKASLPKGERSLLSRCASGEQMIRAIEDLELVKQNRSKMRVAMKKVKSFSDNLKHYFDALDLIVQSHPEFAALVWGAVRFILQLASNYTEFFEKLAAALGRLSDTLPWYEELVNNMKTQEAGAPAQEASTRIRASLLKIYVDIFKFFQHVARVFTKRDLSRFQGARQHHQHPIT